MGDHGLDEMIGTEDTAFPYPDEEPEPLWGPSGPIEGQVIELRDMPGTFVRWTGTRWEMA